MVANTFDLIWIYFRHLFLLNLINNNKLHLILILYVWTRIVGELWSSLVNERRRNGFTMSPLILHYCLDARSFEEPTNAICSAELNF